MRRQSINITHEFSSPVEQVFGYLAEHENLELIFMPAVVSRECDGDVDRNGVGSVRKLKLPFAPPFYESVIDYEPNRRIVYRIIRGGIIKNHRGSMEFASTERGSALYYEIVFEGKVPFVGSIVKTRLEASVRSGLGELDTQLQHKGGRFHEQKAANTSCND